MMSGFGAMSTMNQMIKNNLGLLKKRNRLKENPFLPAGPEIEKRNSTNYSELIEHRFARREFARRISFWTTVFIIATLLIALLFYNF
jgi:hypothetical protein